MGLWREDAALDGWLYPTASVADEDYLKSNEEQRTTALPSCLQLSSSLLYSWLGTNLDQRGAWNPKNWVCIVFKLERTERSCHPATLTAEKTGRNRTFLLEAQLLVTGRIEAWLCLSFTDASLWSQLILQRARGLEFRTPPSEHSVTAFFCWCYWSVLEQI